MTIRFSSSSGRAATLVAALTALAACSTSFDTLVPDRRPDYRQSKPGQRLEVPPDLSLPNTSGASQVPTLASAARPSQAAQPAQGGFTLSGSRDEVFGKVGAALESTAGVTIASRGCAAARNGWCSSTRPAPPPR